MSVVIKGMRMPENCASCPFAERIPPGRTRCLLTCRLLAENYEAPSKLMRNEHCPIEERKKGKWIPKPDIYLDEQTWECSECGEPWIFIEGTPSENRAHFCPNCGADMRGEKDE